MKEHAQVVIKDLNTLELSLVRMEDNWGEEQKQARFNDMIGSSKKQAQALAETYAASVRPSARKLGLDLQPVDSHKESRSFLRELIIALDTGIGFIQEPESFLSKDDSDRLDKIRKEMVEVCKNLDINFEKNLHLAIDNAEDGEFLGSALVSSRVIAFVLDQIQGKTVEDKIASLVSVGAIQKGGDNMREAIIKGDKKARNYLAHRIDTFVDASDTLSLLGDCVTVLKVYAKSI